MICAASSSLSIFYVCIATNQQTASCERKGASCVPGIIGPATGPRVAGRRPRLPASGAQTGAAQAALGLVPSALGQGSNCPALQQRQLLCCLQLWRCAHGMHARMLWGGPAAETAGATVNQAHALFELALEHLRLPCAQTLHSCWGMCFKLLCKRAACSVAVCARALRSCGPKVLPRPEDDPTLFSDRTTLFSDRTTFSTGSWITSTVV